MRLSPLQKYILVEIYTSRVQLFPRTVITKYYISQAHPPKIGDMQNIVTKSLERLIDKELLIGYGHRTPHKWFISEVKLTPLGRRTAKLLQGEQQTLPLRLMKKKPNH